MSSLPSKTHASTWCSPRSRSTTSARPVVDVFWTHEDYLRQFAAAGLEVIDRHAPLGRTDEPWPWVTETEVSPWVVYVLAP